MRISGASLVTHAFGCAAAPRELIPTASEGGWNGLPLWNLASSPLGTDPAPFLSIKATACARQLSSSDSRGADTNARLSSLHDLDSHGEGFRLVLSRDASMPCSATRPSIPLQKSWPTRVRSAVLHAISLARFSLTCARGWPASGLNA